MKTRPNTHTHTGRVAEVGGTQESILYTHAHTAWIMKEEQVTERREAPNKETSRWRVILSSKTFYSEYKKTLKV